MKLYGFLWHVVSTKDAAMAVCESAETEAKIAKTAVKKLRAWIKKRQKAREAVKKLRAWIKKRQKACEVEACACKEDGLITEDITPKMILSGMTQHMVKL